MSRELAEVIALAVYTGLPLRGGFLLKAVQIVTGSMVDALDRPALARTTIIGSSLEIEISGHLSDEDISISLSHEVLEAAAVAALHPPAAVVDLNEAGFESASHRMHLELGTATPVNLNRMLEQFGF